MNCESIRAGDRVWIEGNRAGAAVRWWAVVNRRTRTQLLAGAGDLLRFKRSNGEEIGGAGRCIVALASDDEIAAFEVEQEARESVERLLEAEESALRRELARDMGLCLLSRRGSRYTLTAHGLSRVQVRAMYAAMKGAKR